MTEPTLPRSPRVIDLTAVVVGYGLAALLVRAAWPSSGMPWNEITVLLGLEYLWLGLAMSGPILLLFDRRPALPRPIVPDRPARPKPARPRPFDLDIDALPTRTDAPSRYTWAELAWLVIGAYWIVMTVLATAVRLSGTVLPLLALLHLLVIAACGLSVPKRPAPTESRPAWTHRAALGLLVTWPLAWADLVLLSQTL
jgi:hypothetical protein